MGGQVTYLTMDTNIEFFTIATKGNTQDFGDLSEAKDGLGALGIKLN